MKSKKRSVVALLLMIALTVLLGYTVIFGWGNVFHTGTARNIRTGLDLSGGVSITYETTEKSPSQSDMDDTIYKLQQRVTQYSTEANVYQQGVNRINVEIPGVSDANAILADLGKPGALYFTDENNTTVLDGTDIADAQGVAQTNSQTNAHEYVVDLKFTADGTKKFADVTSENVGKPINIVYDGAIISSPTVEEAITGGSAVINGMPDLETAQNLAAFIRIGSLSLELNEIYSNVVSASLGQDALHTALLAGIIGLCIVILFMIAVYRVSGLAAGWALLIFTLLDLLFINAFDITLTLPGIAGVILTIGMAVDANVIINARIREELAAGRPVLQSLKAGFQKAFSAILDGNVTTLIAAVVLFVLGTGSIQGFATTLAVGVILSMFTSLVLSRVLIYSFYGLGANRESFYGKAKYRKPWKFVEKRAITLAIALVLVLSVPVGMILYNNANGKIMNFSLDFIGGTATTVDFGEDMSLDDLESRVKPVVSEITEDNDIQFQKIQGTDQVVVKTKELSLDQREALNTALAENFENVDQESITAENISSVISGEMRSHAIWAVVIAVACMLFYIFIRFRDFRFASSAVLALVHDIAIVIAFYVWYKASVGSTFIAVMLTILGYSINATIVIFDRVRENMKIMRGEDTATLVNTSITQTLTRSLYSNLTTLIMILVLYIVGVPSIREFALPIIVGLIAGCYSSVFVTGPLWYMMKRKGKVVQPAIAKAEPVLAVDGNGNAISVGGVNSNTTKHVKKDRSLLQSTPKKKKRKPY